MERLSRLLVAGAIAIAAVSLWLATRETPDTAAEGRAEPEVPTVASPGHRAPAHPASVYDPVAAGEPLPEGYRPFLDRDRIAPVYEPVFTSAAGVDWPADSLVVGISGTETAKAYPITHLNQREMVIDYLDGIPILVSW